MKLYEFHNRRNIVPNTCEQRMKNRSWHRENIDVSQRTRSAFVVKFNLLCYKCNSHSEWVDDSGLWSSVRGRWVDGSLGLPRRWRNILHFHIGLQSVVAHAEVNQCILANLASSSAYAYWRTQVLLQSVQSPAPRPSVPEFGWVRQEVGCEYESLLGRMARRGAVRMEGTLRGALFNNSVALHVQESTFLVRWKNESRIRAFSQYE